MAVKNRETIHLMKALRLMADAITINARHAKMAVDAYQNQGDISHLDDALENLNARCHDMERAIEMLRKRPIEPAQRLLEITDKEGGATGTAERAS